MKESKGFEGEQGNVKLEIVWMNTFFHERWLQNCDSSDGVYLIRCSYQFCLV